jgi:hypothetical protein
MAEQYYHTQVVFQGKLRTYRVPVRWRLLSGDGPKLLGSWVASLGFEPFPVPSRVTELVFAALSNPSVQVKLQNEAGQLIDCNISDILDLSDCGTIEVSSIDLPHAKIIPGRGPSSPLEI